MFRYTRTAFTGRKTGWGCAMAGLPGTGGHRATSCAVSEHPLLRVAHDRPEHGLRMARGDGGRKDLAAHGNGKYIGADRLALQVRTRGPV